MKPIFIIAIVLLAIAVLTIERFFFIRVVENDFPKGSFLWKLKTFFLSDNSQEEIVCIITMYGGVMTLVCCWLFKKMSKL